VLRGPRFLLNCSSEDLQMRARRTRRWFSYLLMSGGALLLFFGGRELVESHLGQSQAEHEFEISPTPKPSPFHGTSDVGTSSSPPIGEPQLGDAIAKLTIPRLQTDLYVVEGDGARQLRRGPGHVRGTAMPGSDGNCIIAGHRDTHFRTLKDIQQGDEIVLETRAGKYTYRVETTQVVSPQNTKSLEPTDTAQLHLVTCYPFYYLGSAPKRFIVQAQLEKDGEVTTSTSRPAIDRSVRPILAAAHIHHPAARVRSSRKMN
jgi:sortase A